MLLLILFNLILKVNLFFVFLFLCSFRHIYWNVEDHSFVLRSTLSVRYILPQSEPYYNHNNMRSHHIIVVN